MNIEVIRYRLPIYWACPLINDDYTGLTDEECKEIKRFLEAAEGYPVDVDLETQGFYQYNDAGTLPGECADFIFLLDTTGHKWKINSYKNDILVAGCHRIAYSEMEGVARQLGWD